MRGGPDESGNASRSAMRFPGTAASAVSAHESRDSKKERVSLGDSDSKQTEATGRARQPRFFSIATQFRFGLVLLVGLSLLLTGSVLIYLASRSHLQQLAAVQRERSRAMAGDINASMDDLQRKLGYLAEVRGLSDLSPDIQHDLLEGLTRQNQAFESVAIFDRDGRPVSTASSHGPAIPGDPSDSLLFSRAFEQREAFVSSVGQDPATQLPVVNMAVLVRNRQDEVDGALLAKVNPAFLWSIVSQAAVGETGYAFVVDEHGFIIARTGDSADTFAWENISDRSFMKELTSSAVDPLVAYQGLRGVEVLGAIAPIPSVCWHMVVELPTAEAFAPIRNMVVVMGGALLISIVAAGGLGIGFSRQVVGPLRRLTAAAAEISAGNLNAEVDIVSRNELGTLATSFDEMTARLRDLVGGLEQRTEELQDAQEELVRQEKLAVLGQMAGGIGHELRNPLSVIAGVVDLLQQAHADGDETTLQYLEMISAEVRNSDQIISDLLGFARTRPPARVDTLISELVSSAMERFPPPENVRVTTGIPAHLPAVYVDRQHLALVLHNLISNAYQAMPEGGRLDISSRLEAGQVALSVTDSGCGISPGDRERIFEPLFTTKDRGIGLGLAISRGLVEANGGSIEVESASGDGSIFTITLPVNIAGQSEP